jgi:murein DD-endopeptidase MepM/ murein hydrolase activator NlpD
MSKVFQTLNIKKLKRPMLTLAVALVCTSCFTPAPQSQAFVATDKTNVKVVPERGQNGGTKFVVNNSELSEVTMTFDFNIQNLRGDITFPYTATFKSGETTAFTLWPINTNAEWGYSFTNYYKLGSSVAVPDEFVYSLPYEPGTTHVVTQGFDGKFSHQGSNKYAIDWQMPEGTPVCAARGGLVVKVKDDSDRGGPSMKFDLYNNYVLIRHDDGTLGHYCHLKKDGVKVHPGQIVKTGEVIALSGKTGFASGPHLHFCVFMTKDGRQRVSIPIKYRVADGEAVTLVEGQKYLAPGFQTAKATPSRPATTVIQ